MTLRISEKEFEEKVIKSEKLVLADFYSDSCVPCKRLSPIFSTVEQEYSEDIDAVKININFDLTLAKKYEVLSVPTIIYFKNGKEVYRQNGAIKKNDITEIINKLI